MDRSNILYNFIILERYKKTMLPLDARAFPMKKHPDQSPSPNASHRHSNGAGADPRLERAIRFFDQRFAERVTMKEAAQVACLSPDHFVEVFRSAVGCTPHQYLLQSGCGTPGR